MEECFLDLIFFLLETDHFSGWGQGLFFQTALTKLFYRQNDVFFVTIKRLSSLIDKNGAIWCYLGVPKYV